MNTNANAKPMFVNSAVALLNRVVRAYLYHVPMTEGKKQLLRLTRDLILPRAELVTFVTRHGFRMTVNLRNPEHQRMYFYGEHDERYEVNNLRRILRPGDVCWDIGANIGFCTCLFASLVGPSGRVMAFEPAPTSRELLQENLDLNRFDNVTLVPKALGALRERQPLYFTDLAAAEGTASLLSSESRLHHRVVEVDTIDDLSAELPRPDLIKIDVEGYQLEVLRGARHFFSAHGPMVMAELKDLDRNKMLEAQHYFHDLDYLLFEFHKHSLQLCDDILASRKRNFLMVKRDSPYSARIASLRA
jgi:FkbM family methyltransferase